MDTNNNKKVRYFVLDTETTGVKNTDRPCQVAWIEINENFEKIVGEDRTAIIDPEIPIPAITSGIHRITNEMVENEPTMKEYFEITLPKAGWDPEGDFVLIAHNASFDQRMMKGHMEFVSTICTMRLARRIWKFQSNALQALIYELGLGTGELAHSARGDVRTTYELLLRIVSESKLNMRELEELSFAPIPVEKMTFGKHRGMRIVDLPAKYVRWLKEDAKDISEDLRHALNVAHP